MEHVSGPNFLILNPLPTKYAFLQKVLIVQTEQRKKELIKIAYVQSEYKIYKGTLEFYKVQIYHVQNEMQIR